MIAVFFQKIVAFLSHPSHTVVLIICMEHALHVLKHINYLRAFRQELFNVSSFAVRLDSLMPLLLPFPHRRIVARGDTCTEPCLVPLGYQLNVFSESNFSPQLLPIEVKSIFMPRVGMSRR